MMEHIPREFQAIIGCHSDVEIRPLKYHPVSDHGIGWETFVLMIGISRKILNIQTLISEVLICKALEAICSY